MLQWRLRCNRVSYEKKILSFFFLSFSPVFFLFPFYISIFIFYCIVLSSLRFFIQCLSFTYFLSLFLLASPLTPPPAGVLFGPRCFLPLLSVVHTQLREPAALRQTLALLSRRCALLTPRGGAQHTVDSTEQKRTDGSNARLEITLSTPTEEVKTIIAEILKSLNEIKLPVDEIKKEENIPCDKPKVIFLSFFLSLSLSLSLSFFCFFNYYYFRYLFL